MHSASFRTKLKSGALWSLTGSLAVRCSSIIITVVIARLLSVENFGKLAIITSTVAMLSSFAGLGLAVTCTRYVAQLRYIDPARAGRIVRLAFFIGLFSGCFMAFVAFAAAPFIAGRLLSAPDLINVLRIASFLLLTDTLLSLQIAVLSGFQAFPQITRITIYQGLLALPLTVTAVWLWGITGAVAATFVISACGLFLSHLFSRALIRGLISEIDEMSIWSEFRIIRKLALPASLAGIVVTPAIWMGNAVLSQSAGGFEQVGIFNAANQWRMLLAFLPSVLGNVLLPLISTPEHQSSAKLKAVNFLSGWILVSAPAFILIFFPEITGMILGSKYDTSSYRYSLIILMLVACISAYKEGIARRIITDDLMWWGVCSNLIWGGMLAGLLVTWPATTSSTLVNYYLLCYGVSTIVFVPFYLKKGIMPAAMLYSKESLLVWFTLLTGFYCHLQQTSLLTRIIVSPFLAALMVWSFIGLWHKMAQLLKGAEERIQE
ncbi:polysaccharide biosynthesis protein [Geobacter sp. OR-1]|uniref:oligosaccharide flippase family protein n=1 Tax=Geobacter sp. OR-1 TaxID=1266765 RepID=UPI000543C0C8|nr:oligosaccharide flippase family protein [Geobacter sp. OR-1]GAM08219.1 polysaccharide biosynthesis protein [Geobacter sp. OR-1]